MTREFYLAQRQRHLDALAELAREWEKQSPYKVGDIVVLTLLASGARYRYRIEGVMARGGDDYLYYFARVKKDGTVSTQVMCLSYTSIEHAAQEPTS